MKLFHPLISVESAEPLLNAEFTHHANTRLTSLTTRIITSSTVQCATMCLMTNGCLAVGVTTSGDVISCNLATNFSATEFQNDHVFLFLICIIISTIINCWGDYVNNMFSILFTVNRFNCIQNYKNNRLHRSTASRGLIRLSFPHVRYHM